MLKQNQIITVGSSQILYSISSAGCYNPITTFLLFRENGFWKFELLGAYHYEPNRPSHSTYLQSVFISFEISTLFEIDAQDKYLVACFLGSVVPKRAVMGKLHNNIAIYIYQILQNGTNLLRLLICTRIPIGSNIGGKIELGFLLVQMELSEYSTKKKGFHVVIG